MVSHAGLYQELMEEKLISAVSSQFGNRTLDFLRDNIKRTQDRLIELENLQHAWESELAQMKAAQLAECENILREQQIIEVI